MASKSSRLPKRKRSRDQRSKLIPRRPNAKFKNSTNPNLIPLGKNQAIEELLKKKKAAIKEMKVKMNLEKKVKAKVKVKGSKDTFLLSTAPPSKQLSFFLDRFQSANAFKLSPLELEAFKDTCVVELSQDINQDVDNFSKHMKATFGMPWREVLCGNLSEGSIDAGSPAVLIISTSALRSLELLRGLKPFTTECRAVKLFAKHMKVEDQVAMLKARVNIASGTPSRIKKLIDMDALSLSRLQVVVLDMHQDAKGYSLLTLPQVSAEFWDLYKSCFHQRLLQGDTRFCFYGAVPSFHFKENSE